MKKVILFIMLMCISLSAVRAQQADAYIASLINDEDWFSLAEEWPQYRDSLTVDYLKLIADAMLASHTNHPDDAITALNQLLAEHQEKIGSATSINFALMRLQLIGSCGRYGEAADGIRRIYELLESAGVTETKHLHSQYAHYNALRDFAPMSISRPVQDVTIPFQLMEPQVKRREDWMRSGSKGYKGNMMTVPVSIHGKDYSFIFDTGAGATFIFEKTAREMGLTILPDTIIINGSQKGLRAYIDSLQIGDITCRNLIAYVGLSDAIDTLMVGTNAILGMDIMAALGELQLHMNRQEMTIPAHSTPIPLGMKANLLIDGNLLMRAHKDSIPLTFYLDSGCSTAELYSDYFKKFASEVELTAQKDTITTLSYGQIHNEEVLLLPTVSFNVSGKPIRMEEMYLHPSSEAYLSMYDGRMGMEYFLLFNSVLINLNDMYVLVE